MTATRTVEDPTRRYYVRTPTGAMVGPYTQRGAETVKNRRNVGAGPLSRCEVVRQDVPAESTQPPPATSSKGSDPGPAAPAAGRSRRRGQAAPAKDSVPAESGGATAATSPDGRCLCGCGEPVTREFKPGHDARYKSQLVQAAIAGDEQAVATIAARGWNTFLEKGRRSAERRTVTAERRETAASNRPPTGRSNHELLDTMKAARAVLLELGRYGRAAGTRRIEITGENAQAIADRTFDFDGAPDVEPMAPRYGMPGYEAGEAEVTRHIAPLRTKAERDAAKARRRAENSPNTSSLQELLP